MHILDIQGSGFERGQAIGETYASEIRQLAEDNFTTIHENAKAKSYSYIPREKFNALAERCIPWAREYDPDLMAELEGIAAGASLPLNEVVAVNGFLDLADLMYPYLADRLLFGCTSWGMNGRMTQSGESLIGQTYDVRVHYQPYPTVMRIKPNDAPSCVVYSFKGMLGLAGMNSEGISVVINKLTPDDSGPGVPYPMIVRRILKARNLAAAVDAVVNTRRASGINYILADRNGQVLDIESTAQDFDIIELQREGFVIHTNHNHSPRLRTLERARRRFIDESCTRWDRMTYLVREQAGTVTPEQMEANMHDHGNFPKCICVHPDETEPFYKRVITTGAVLIEPQQQKIKVACGSPCENYLQEVSLP